MNHFVKYCVALATGLAAYLTTLPVQAEIEEIVVTARQREELLTDVPATITAFTSGEIERASIERAEDFIALTPGVSFVDTAEVGDAQVSIRGINGSRDAETNFGFIVDGILYTNPSAFNREFADIQQIEVLKGPQGAVYGRSASSGAIIVTTNKPTQEFSGSAKASVGTDSTYRVSAHASGGLTDGLAGRLHFDYRDSDGFYNNTNVSADPGPGKHSVDAFEAYNINGRLLWEPTDNLSVDFRGHYGEVDASSITFNVAFHLEDAANFTGFQLLNEDVNKHEYKFHPNIRPENDQETLDFSIKADYDMEWAALTGWFLYSDIEQSFLADGTSAAFNFFALEPACMTSLANTAAGGATPDPLPPPQNNTGVPFDASNLLGPYTPTTCDGAQWQERNQEDISFEFRLTSPGDQRLRWQAGAYYLNLEREVGVASVEDPGVGFVPGAEVQRALIGPQTEALVYDRFDTEVFAVFGQVAYDLTDDVELAAAIRYDSEKREVTSLVPAPDVQTSDWIDYTDIMLFFPSGLHPCMGLNDGRGSPLNPAFIDFSTPSTPSGCTINQSIPDRQETFKEVQPKISLRWNMNDNWTLFGSWGVGFKSGGFNNQGSEATVNLFFNSPEFHPVALGGTTEGAGLSISDRFEKETSNAFELGFKSNFYGGSVSMEGAIYHTLVDDMQIFNFFVGPFGLLRVVSNIDEVSITGAEYAMSTQLTDAFRIYGGGAITNAKIDKNSNRPQTVGNRVPYAPEYTLNIGAELITPSGLFDGVDFVGRIDYSKVGPTRFAEPQEGDRTPTLFTGLMFGEANQTNATRDSYGLVNIRAGLQSDNWGLHGVVKNATNAQFPEEVIPAPEFGGAFVHPGSERSWAMEFSYQF
ncbi:MAG: TonB-dependent receptor [Gammaproteobacteria bacterium]